MGVLNMKQRSRQGIDTASLPARLRRIAEEYGIGEFSDARRNLPIRKRFTHAEICDIVERCHGLTHDICALMDCSAAEWRAYLRVCPDVAEVQSGAREGVVDRAESRLYDSLDSDNEQVAQKAAEFTLKTLGRTRGYDVQGGQEITLKDGEVNIKTIFGIE